MPRWLSRLSPVAIRQAGGLSICPVGMSSPCRLPAEAHTPCRRSKKKRFHLKPAFFGNRLNHYSVCLFARLFVLLLFFCYYPLAPPLCLVLSVYRCIWALAPLQRNGLIERGAATTRGGNYHHWVQIFDGCIWRSDTQIQSVRPQ